MMSPLPLIVHHRDQAGALEVVEYERHVPGLETTVRVWRFHLHAHVRQLEQYFGIAPSQFRIGVATD